MFDFIYQGLGYVIRFCYYTIGFESYALALLWFALIVKFLLLPFGIKQQKNQIKGAKLRPKMYAIEKKYAGRTDQVTMRKKQQEIMEMQQKEGYSPLSGCLPMLIQLPLILILYRIIQRPLSYICMLGEDKIKALADAVEVTNVANEIEIVGKIGGNVAPYAEILGEATLPNFLLFGNIDLSVSPSFASLAILIPIIVFASQFFTMKLSRWLNPMMAAQSQTKEAETSMKIMDLAMPLMTLFLAFSLPAALGLYWFFQAILGIAQMLLLAKLMPLPTFTEEELKAAERELRGKAPRRRVGAGNGGTTESAPTAYDADEERPRPRSLHHIDDDDYDEPAATPPAKKKTTNGGNGRSSIATAPLKKDKKDD